MGPSPGHRIPADRVPAGIRVDTGAGAGRPRLGGRRLLLVGPIDPASGVLGVAELGDPHSAVVDRLGPPIVPALDWDVAEARGMDPKDHDYDLLGRVHAILRSS